MSGTDIANRAPTAPPRDRRCQVWGPLSLSPQTAKSCTKSCTNNLFFSRRHSLYQGCVFLVSDFGGGGGPGARELRDQRLDLRPSIDPPAGCESKSEKTQSAYNLYRASLSVFADLISEASLPWSARPGPVSHAGKRSGVWQAAKAQTLTLRDKPGVRPTRRQPESCESA
eukprot:1299990-Rhodomonas_salina.2